VCSSDLPVGIIAPDWPSRDTERELQLTFDDGPEPVRSALAPTLKEVPSRKVEDGGFRFFVLGGEVSHSHSAIAEFRRGAMSSATLMGSHNGRHEHAF